MILETRLVCIDLGIKSECVFTIDCGDTRFHIRIPQDAPTGSIARKTLEQLDAYQISGDEECLDIFCEQLCDTIIIECRPLFSSYLNSRAPTGTLSDIVGNPPIRIKMTSDLGPMRYVPDDDDPKLCQRQSLTLRPIKTPDILRRFNASDLQLKATLKQDTTFLVVFDNSPFCAKIGRQPSQRRALEREIESLYSADTIRRAGLRIPTLEGLICTEKSVVIGFLMDYIDSRSLASIAIEQVALEQRKRWFEEIEGSLERLHGVGVIWGDAKPDNVLIDRDENIWLIDFGGGWSTGWVDSHLHDSIEGDKQGSRRMKKYLQIE